MSGSKQEHSSSSPYGYLPSVDGLRALAVIAILLFHLDVSFVPGGFVGVDIFFVISGFLITSIIAGKMERGEFSFAQFYANRIRRIFPALFVMLFFTSVAAVFFLGLDEYSDFFSALRKASAQIANFHFVREIDYFAAGDAHSPLLHTWSLGVEEQFYLVWPLLMFLVYKFWNKARWPLVLGVLALISLALSEYWVRSDAMMAFYMLPSRAWQLALGGFLGLSFIPAPSNARVANISAIVGVSLIMLAALFYTSEGFPGLKALMPSFGAALFIYSARSNVSGWVHKILSIRPVVFVGLISYSLYLWHWPLIAIYKSYFAEELSVMAQVSLGASSFGLAVASYYLVEQPFRRIQAAPWKVILVGVLVIVAFVVAGNVMKKFRAASWRVTYDVVEHMRRPFILDGICSVEGRTYELDGCIVGPNKDKYEVILAGDSHAWHYAPAVLGWAKERGLTVRLLMRGACRTWQRSEKVRMRYGKVDQSCEDMTTYFYERLEKDPSILYVFLGARTPKESDDIRRSLAEISSYNKKMYFLGSVPEFRDNPHLCHFKSNLLVTRWFPGKARSDCLEIDLEYTNKRLAPTLNGFVPLLEEFSIPYFDPRPFLQEPFDDKGRFIYMDDDHLNRYGGPHLIAPLSDFIEAHEKQSGRSRQ